MEDGACLPRADMSFHPQSSILHSRFEKLNMAEKEKPSLNAKLRRTRLFLCDVDGVMTDGAVFIGGAREIKRFDIRDGFGLVLLRRAGLKTGWISSRPSPVTRLRARELKIDFLVQQDVGKSKVAAVEKLLERTRRRWDEVCYAGDDVMDLGVLRRAGVAVAVGNGIREVKAAAHYVTRAPGGHGAIREVAEMILKAQGKWKPIVAHYQE
jgi:3-deoxy-D-manno-octulosonate 8-phosphate phosphatase (KDO 8-P phosphatase)